MIQILFQADHEDRARKLAAMIGGPRCHEVNTRPSMRLGLSTLLFFGHGTPGTLCGKIPEGIKEIAKRWKKRNPGLKTIECIGCNTRHTEDLGEAFIPQLKAFMRNSRFTNNMMLKSFPVHVNGSQGSYSIMSTDWETNSWCYIAAPTSREMWAARNELYREAQGPFKVEVGPHGVPGCDVAQAADKIVNETESRLLFLQPYKRFEAVPEYTECGEQLTLSYSQNLCGSQYGPGNVGSHDGRLTFELASPVVGNGVQGRFLIKAGVPSRGPYHGNG